MKINEMTPTAFLTDDRKMLLFADSDQLKNKLELGMIPLYCEAEILKFIQSDQHAELKAQYTLDVETCKSIDGLEAWQLWQKKAKEYTDWNIIKPISNIAFYADYDYRRHPHADSIIEYHKGSDADKKRWQIKCNDGSWKGVRVEPVWDEYSDYRLKPRTITINSVEYNAPMNVAPEVDTHYWVINFEFEFGFVPLAVIWIEDESDYSALEKSHAFGKYDDCKAVADALNAILSGEL
jgi:hypothetical protein